MTHKSRLGCMVIDCKGEDLASALAFWSAALGLDGEIDKDGKYAVLKTTGDDIHVLLQAVDHDSRVHLDIETDDKAVEIRRLESLGAKSVARMDRWTVMQAPTGHRFCVVDPQRSGFAQGATEWTAARTGGGR